MYVEIVCLGLPVLIVFGKMSDKLGVHLGTCDIIFSKVSFFFSGFVEVRGRDGGIAEQMKCSLGIGVIIVLRLKNKKLQ